MSHTYLFYDIETTGLNKAFDQVVHFAAIRTDLSLQEINRYELKIKLNPDVTPSPEALITHKMGVTEIMQGISEWEAMQSIHQWLNEPGTISLGYNTLGFDDEFLRFCFYRNLLPPYTHQYANGCGRMDIYPMTTLYYLFHPAHLVWPQKEGQPSLKLEALNASNRFVTGRSHHAMVDVEVTLALARRLQQQEATWMYLLGYFNKQTDAQRMQSLQHGIALAINGAIGYKRHYQSPSLFLGHHQHYKNQSVWIPLDQEIVESDITRIRTFSKRLGEPPFLLPFKKRFLTHLTPERYTLATDNETMLKTNTSLLCKLRDYATHYTYPNPPNVDPDASLYTQGFWSTAETAFCQAFQRASTLEKARLIDQAPSTRLHIQALRLVGRHWPDRLTPAQQRVFLNYLECVAENNTDTPVDFQNRKHYTRTDALQDIATLRATQIDQEAHQLLTELEYYLTQ